MRLDYFAHSCFLLSHEGFRVLFDPYPATLGYPLPRVQDPDVVVVSHDHHDHNAVASVNGRAQVVRGVARRTFGPLTLSGAVGWHQDGDDAETVSLTLLEWGGRRLAHFGDLGGPLDREQESLFQNLDLLLVPCGGRYTLDGPQAAQLVRHLAPKIAVPMHYDTPFLNRQECPGLETAQRFLAACREFARVETIRSGQAALPSYWGEGEATGTTVLDLHHQMA